MYSAIPDAMLTTVFRLGSVTVNALLPTFRTSTDWPVDTSVAGGRMSFRLPTVAVTSMMLATTLAVLPFTGHCKTVSLYMVRLS